MIDILAVLARLAVRQRSACALLGSRLRPECASVGGDLLRAVLQAAGATVRLCMHAYPTPLLSQLCSTVAILAILAALIILTILTISVTSRYDAMTRAPYAPGESIFEQDDIADSFYGECSEDTT